MCEADYSRVVHLTEGYSGSDMHALCREAAMGPMRDPGCDIRSMATDAVRPITMADFEGALCQVRASVAPEQRDALLDWDRQFGSFKTKADHSTSHEPAPAGSTPGNAAPSQPGGAPLGHEHLPRNGAEPS